MKYTDMHTHSVFSDGKNTLEENVLSAISKNMLSLGISDHCYTYFDESYCVQKDDLQNYLAEARRLQKLYRDQIEIYVGIELDGFARLDDRAAYDYIIGDCHYVTTPEGNIAVDISKDDFMRMANLYFGGDTVKLAESYYEGYARTVKEMRPDILGHIDLVTKFSLVNEEDKRYIDASTAALIEALKVCPVLEMNTGAISRGYRTVPYPSKRLLREAVAHGGKILLSSDSHSAANLTFHFDECLELLRAEGIRSTVVYTGGEFKEVGIDK